MMQRPIYEHMPSQKSAPSSSLLTANLADLYWLVHVVQAGSFSAAAQRTGVAKSNLSRRIIQLEKRMEVQLLIRKPRALHLTPTGSRIYHHALTMLQAAEAAEEIAKEATGSPRGPLHMAAPGILSPWLYDCLRTFSERHHDVELYLIEADDLTDLASNHLDISLSFHDVPGDSTDIVSRPLAQLEMVIVGTPQIIENLGRPTRLSGLEDRSLLATQSSNGMRPWIMIDGEKVIATPALCARDYQAVLNATRAGLGLACLPLQSCIADLHADRLQLTCLAEHPKTVWLYTLMNPHRSITPAARALVKHLRQSLETQAIVGMSALNGSIIA